MKDVKTVGIIGFGVMGAAIGLNAAANGSEIGPASASPAPRWAPTVVVGITQMPRGGLFWGRTGACGFGEGLCGGTAHEEHTKNTKNTARTRTNNQEHKAHTMYPASGPS